MPIASMINLSDEDLARDARAGSVDCFEELVRRYQVPLMRFLQRQASNRQEAEDVIQDAFLRAWQSIETYTVGRSFKPWLFTIACRVAIDLSRKRRPVVNSVIEAESRFEQGPFSQAQVNDSRDHLWQKVKQVLREEQFLAVWLHYGESMPTGEIALVIGRSRVWVKTTLLRARSKIRAVLETEKTLFGRQLESAVHS